MRFLSVLAFAAGSLALAIRPVEPDAVEADVAVRAIDDDDALLETRGLELRRDVAVAPRADPSWGENVSPKIIIPHTDFKKYFEFQRAGNDEVMVRLNLEEVFDKGKLVGYNCHDVVVANLLPGKDLAARVVSNNEVLFEGILRSSYGGKALPAPARPIGDVLVYYNEVRHISLARGAKNPSR